MHVTADGHEALEFLNRAQTDPSAPVPKFLLLDINLPRIDGFEVLRRVRSSARFKDIPVLVLSSSDSQVDRARAAELGASYFRKAPSYFEFMQLGGVLKNLLKAHFGYEG